ncbi:PEP-CTERM protein-sorting domain-containing protein [Prosthecobacter debontii]|uniref:PEP-CTERM protein-sorting domain-containing protein n=1 Tax=Prosthecobacter debontii TaxID=48467 RepID=A0A1T4YPN6_9BACT|nr:CAP domain-containing protein [Prosthecobacter debontii]SKB03794.1 PEP-CTERM protein-sorting domain-containing protein [Prosthecobacter debontii]
MSYLATLHRSCLAGLVGLCCLTQTLVAADPTAEQQYWLEIINRMRRAPAEELEQIVNMSSPGVWDSVKSDHPTIAAALNFYGVSAAELYAQWSTLSSAPPLAWNSSLNTSATNYSNTMVSQDQQAHGIGGQTVSQKIIAGGYSSQWLEAAESLFATGVDVLHGHAALAIDWGPDGGSGTGLQPGTSHRETLMSARIKEIGIGFQTISIPGSNTEVTGPLVITQHSATQYRSTGSGFVSDAILTGVVYADSIAADLFYTPGEGWAGTQIFIFDDLTNQLLASGVTNSAGGFNIALTGFTDGMLYRVEAPDTGLASQTFTLNAHTEVYGAPVLFYDNVYAAFQIVPEPGTLGLLAISGVLLFQRRRSLL